MARTLLDLARERVEREAAERAEVETLRAENAKLREREKIRRARGEDSLPSKREPPAARAGAAPVKSEAVELEKEPESENPPEPPENPPAS